MATNIQLDESLVSQVMELGNLKTKKEAVNTALAEFVRRHEQKKVIELFGTLEEEPSDYKAQRRTE